MHSRENDSIVIVEDDLSMSKALERILRLAEHKTITYPSAEAMLASPHNASAACLIVDVQLPGMSGLELHARLMAKGPTPPVIFITAFDDAKVREQAQRAGAIALLAKPFSGRVLLATVRGILAAAQVVH